MMANLYPLLIIAVVLFIILHLAGGLIWVEPRFRSPWHDCRIVSAHSASARWSPTPSNYSQKKTEYRPSPIKAFSSSRLPLLWLRR